MSFHILHAILLTIVIFVECSHLRLTLSWVSLRTACPKLRKSVRGMMVLQAGKPAHLIADYGLVFAISIINGLDYANFYNGFDNTLKFNYRQSVILHLLWINLLLLKYASLRMIKVCVNIMYRRTVYIYYANEYCCY